MVASALADVTQETRLVDAALRCVARWGVAKTSLDDVAREASCSRATVYRTFPGGKESLFEAVARTELNRFFRRLAERLERAESLEDLLVIGMAESHRALRSHEALQFLLAHEPEIVLPRLAFHRLELPLAAAAAFAAPYLAPHIGERDAHRVGEWVARLVLSYTLSPSEQFDLSNDDDVRRLVRQFVLPGLGASAEGGSLQTREPSS